MSTTSFEKNPVVFYNHDTYSLPIGKGRDLCHEPDGSITLDIDFDAEDEQALAVQKKAERGFLNACSVGIDVLETSADASVILAGQTRPTVTRCELLELSICGIPGNRNALRLNGVQTENIEHILPKINYQKELNMKPAFNSFDLPETAADEAILDQLAALENEDVQSVDPILVKLDILDQKITALSAAQKPTKKTSRLTDLMQELRKENHSPKAEMTWAQLQVLPKTEFEAYRIEHKESYDKLFYSHYGFEPIY
jgi:HK97 family phage prohead protease